MEEADEQAEEVVEMNFNARKRKRHRAKEKKAAAAVANEEVKEALPIPAKPDKKPTKKEAKKL